MDALPWKRAQVGKYFFHYFHNLDRYENDVDFPQIFSYMSQIDITEGEGNLPFHEIEK